MKNKQSTTYIKECKRLMDLFIRQSFTQADEAQQALIQSVIDEIKQQYSNIHFLTGTRAQSRDSFKADFESETGQDFSPVTFRKHRLKLIDRCDAMVFIRTSMSESGAFELSYNLHTKKPKPVFYAVWDQASITTTLLRDLDKEFPVTYKNFSSAQDMMLGLDNFFKKHKLNFDQEAEVLEE